MLSIIIPTLNEAVRIEELLRYTHALPGAHEVLVVDGGSSDGTPELVRALGLPLVRVLNAPRGRANQMNAGAAQARGAVLVFLHADTRLPANALPQIAQTLSDPQAQWGAFLLQFDERGPLYQLIAWSTNLRSRRRHFVTGDQAIFVRTEVFRQAGGFPPLALMEDVALSRTLWQRSPGHLLTPPVLVSARRHRQYGPLRVLLHGWWMQLRWNYARASEERLRREYPDVR